MNVAGYARVSTSGQVKDDNSLPNQRKAIEDKAKKEGWELAAIYEDGGISGGSLDRPELERMRMDAKEGKFDAVLFTKLDRLGRSVRDIHNLFYEFKTESGIDLICIDDPSLNTSGKMGGLMLGIMSSFAEFERRLIQERMIEGRKAKWDKGQLPVGDQLLPFGYKKNEAGKIEIVPEHGKIYQRMVSLYLDERLSSKEIAIRLSHEAIPTPSQLRSKKRNSSRWNGTTVLDLLRHPAFAGEAKYNKDIFEKRKGNKYMTAVKRRPEGEWITVPFPALISRDRWQEIQNRIETQRHKPKRIYKGYEDNFLLDGLLYCDECGGRMRKKLKMDRKGKVRLYYSCYWQFCSKHELEIAGKEKCIMTSAHADKIDKAFFNQVINLLSDPDKYAETWFKDMDSAALLEKLKNLHTRDKELVSQLKTGFKLMSTQKTGLKGIYLEEYQKWQAEWEATQPEIKKTRADLDMIKNKVDRYKQFKEAMESGGIRDKFRKRFATQIDFSRFMTNLPFSEKRRIVEALIAPEKGGKAMVAYLRPIDIGEGLENMTPEQMKQPITDRPPMVFAEFEMNLDKIEAVIASLDRTSLLKQSNSSQIAGRQEDTR
jgi:site-specific DNA recombinase